MIFVLFFLCILLQFAIVRNNTPLPVKFAPALFSLLFVGIGYLTDDLAAYLYGGSALIGLGLGALIAAGRANQD